MRMLHTPKVLGAACAIALGIGSATTTQAQNYGTVSVGITEAVTSHNPYADAVVLIGSIWCQVYGCLTRYDFEQGEVVPYVAESLVAEDDYTWRLTLRRDWVRHNGDAILAEDVVHSIERIKTDPQSVMGFFVRMIEEMEILDDYTVRLTTNEPTATLPDYFSLIQVTSKRLHDEHGGRQADRHHPHGAGPYRLVDLEVGSHMVIERVDGHPMVSEHNPERIIYRVMAEPEQRVTALANGEIQIAQGIPPQLVDRVERMNNARVEFADSVEMMFLAMNPSHAPWDVKEVRQAANHAIHREGIVRALLGGRATLLNGPIGANMYGYDPDYRSPYDYDPERARRLLEEAGMIGVEVDLYTPVGRYVADRQIAEAIASMLEEVGFAVNLQTPEWATLWSNVQRGGVPFYYMGRGQMLDPSRALAQYFETDQAPRLDYSNPEVDRLLQAERAEFDPAERVSLLRQAAAALDEDAAAGFLWTHHLAWGVAQGIAYQPRSADRVDGWDIRLE